jgi:hypothetical protein
MKNRIAFVLLMGLLIPNLVNAQQSPASDLNTLLRDSAYVFNRFEEISIGLGVRIDGWKMPDEVKKSEKDALSAILRNVDAEKPAINGLLGKSAVSSTDLLDVYTEMVEVASELQGSSSEDACFGDGELSSELAQLGAKAAVLGAKIGVTLRSQIAAQELRLTTCSQKTSSRK